MNDVVFHHQVRHPVGREEPVEPEPEGRPAELQEPRAVLSPTSPLLFPASFSILSILQERLTSLIQFVPGQFLRE